MDNEFPDAAPYPDAPRPAGAEPADAAAQPPTAGTATHFESMIAAGLNNPSLSGPVVNAFLGTEVYFLSREEVTGQNPHAQPLLLSNAAGTPMVAIFTSLERIPGTYIDQAPYGVLVKGSAVIRSLSDTGVVVNPGSELSFQIPAEGVAELKEELLHHKPDQT